MGDDARQKAYEAMKPLVEELEAETRGRVVEALLAYRQAQGTAWREFGEAWGTSHSTFHTIARGTKPSDEVLAKFLAFYSDFKSTPQEWLEWHEAFKALMSA